MRNRYIYMVLGVLCCTLLAIGVYAKINLMRYNKAAQSQPERFCAQVVTPARNKNTGEIKDFPTPCLPEDWQRVAPIPTNTK
jgi:hypothetical protein